MRFKELDSRSTAAWFLGSSLSAFIGAMLFGVVGFILAGGVGGLVGLAVSGIGGRSLAGAVRWSMCGVLSGSAGLLLSGDYGGFVGSILGWVFCPIFGEAGALSLVVFPASFGGLGWFVGFLGCGVGCVSAASLVLASVGGLLGLLAWRRAGFSGLLFSVVLGFVLGLGFLYLVNNDFSQPFLSLPFRAGLDVGIALGCLASIFSWRKAEKGLK